MNKIVLTLAAVVMAAGLVACGQPTAAQKEKLEFDAKCKATPSLAECKDWKEGQVG